MLLALPILLPLLTAIVLHLMPQRSRPLRVVAFSGSLGVLTAAVWIFVGVQRAGIQVLQIGSWPAPFGITLVADVFSAVMVVMVSVIGVAVTGSSFAGIDPRRESFGYHPLIQVVLMGVTGAFLTGDIFNLYVWFEVMLIGSFVLMALHRTRAQLHAAFPYVGLKLLAAIAVAERPHDRRERELKTSRERRDQAGELGCTSEVAADKAADDTGQHRNGHAHRRNIDQQREEDQVVPYRQLRPPPRYAVTGIGLTPGRICCRYRIPCR